MVSSKIALQGKCLIFTIIDKIFETNSCFPVKYHTAGKFKFYF